MVTHRYNILLGLKLGVLFVHFICDISFQVSLEDLLLDLLQQDLKLVYFSYCACFIQVVEESCCVKLAWILSIFTFVCVLIIDQFGETFIFLNELLLPVHVTCGSLVFVGFICWILENSFFYHVLCKYLVV